ncbi:MAG: GNAT family N-acetyltransferase [Candidatus Promineifilaceae bacterium]|nr:GNAT family N-acetyltransferase [Candidatus Promineifilaceae bacterium]
MDIVIREMRAADWEDVRFIYQQGIDTGQATFETAVPSWTEWETSKRPDCRLIAQCEEQIVGWAALSPVSHRAVYAGVAEVSIYVLAKSRRQGVGTSLMKALIEAAEQAGVWTLQSSIFPENEATITLHLKSGFRIVGRRERIARHHDRWRDTIILERRSRITGV